VKLKLFNLQFLRHCSSSVVFQETGFLDFAGLKNTFFISQFLKQFSYVGVPEGASAGGIEFTM
jgi:hypothetical protein